MEVRAESKGLVEFKDDRVFTWPTLVAKEFLAAILLRLGCFLFVCGRCPT